MSFTSLLKSKALIAVVAAGVAFAAAAVIFSVQMTAMAQEPFGGSGYVLQSNDQSENQSDQQQGSDSDSQSAAPSVSTVAFGENDSYRLRYPDTVSFKATDGSDASLSQKSFIHYDDKSAAAFVKAVFVDLDSISDQIIYYYDLPAGEKMQFTGNSWTLANGGNQLEFSNVLMKIDESHYLVLSDDITFTVNGETQMNFQGPGSYLEIEYVDEGVIRFMNDQGVYQTISSDATVTLGNGTSINFGNKVVSSGDGDAKLSLGQMVVGADDNIEISDSEKAALENANNGDNANGEENADGTGAAGGSGEGGDAGATDGGTTAVATGGDGGSSSSSAGASSGVISGEEEDNSEVVEDNNDSRTAPAMNISNGSTTPVGFSAQFSISDEKNMLTSGTKVTIVNKETGEVVYESSVAAGVLNFDVNATGLDPDTEYVISASATYRDGDTDYTKSFLDKVFKTDPVGISISKDYATSDSLSLAVSIGAYANVNSVDLLLTDADGNKVEEKQVDPTEARLDGGETLLFSNLNSNTSYFAELTNVTYSNVTVDSFGDKVEFKTLRKMPTLPNPVVQADRKASQFTLSLPTSGDNAISDPDAGITGYTWQVFESSSYTAGEKGEPVYTGSPASGTSITVPVDGITLTYAKAYVARCIVTFDDNEKTVVYETPVSSAFSMDGLQYPSIRMETTELTWEHFKGDLYIDNVTSLVREKPLTIVYRDSLGNGESVTVDDWGTEVAGSVVIPCNWNNLRANTIYTVEVYGTVDLKDGNGEAEGYIGSTQFTTGEPQTAKANFKPTDGSSESDSFSVNFWLTAMDETQNIDLEMSTMNQIAINLYEGDENSGKLLKSYPLTGGNSLKDPYNSSLKNAIYGNGNFFTITPDSLNISASDIKSNTQYTIVVGPAQDYTSNKNEAGKLEANDLPIDENSKKYVIKTANEAPELPTDRDAAINATAITNGMAAKYGLQYDGNLAADTIVAYQIQSTFPNGNRIAKKITYTVNDVVNGTTKNIVCAVGEDGTIPSYIVKLDGSEGDWIKRGHRFKFTYTATLDLKGDGQELTYPDCKEQGAVLGSPQCNAPFEAAQVQMYLKSRGNAYSTQDGGAMWEYTTKDADNVLGNKGDNAGAWFTSRLTSTGSFEKRGAVSTSSGSWSEVAIPFQEEQTYTICLNQNRYAYNRADDVESTNLASHYVDKKRDMGTGSGAQAKLASTVANIDANRGVMDVTVKTTANFKEDDKRAVAALKLTCAATNSTNPITLMVAPSIVSDGEGGTYSINAEVQLKQVADLIGVDFNVSAQVIYDTGWFGYVNNGVGNGSLNEDGNTKSTWFVMQDLASVGKYISLDSNCSYSQSDSANGRAYDLGSTQFAEPNAQTAFNGNASDYNWKELISGTESNLKMMSSAQGPMLVNSNGQSSGYAVTPKWLTASGSLTSDSVKFDSVPPIVSGVTASAEVDRAEVNYKAELVKTEAKDGALIVELYKKNESGTYELMDKYRYTGALPASNGSSFVLPSDADKNPLEPGKEYMFKLSAEVKKEGSSDDEYKESPVVDASTGQQLQYTFTTAGSVTIKSPKVWLEAKSDNPYSTKSLNVSYELDKALGFTVTTEIFAADDNGKPTGNALLTYGVPDINYTNGNKLTAEYNPGGENVKKLPLGHKYVAVITARGNAAAEDATPLGQAEVPFDLNKLAEPMASISARPTFDNSNPDQKKYGMTFNASVFDLEGSLVNGEYKVRFFKGNDQISTKYDGQIFKATTRNQQFVLEDLAESTQYTMRVYGVKDVDNTGDKGTIASASLNGDTLIASASGKTTPSSGVDVGSVMVTAQSSDKTKMTLNFYNSVGITTATKIRYTVASSDGTVVGSGTEGFTPTLREVSGTKYYTYNLPTSLGDKYGQYNIQVTYLDDSGKTLASGTYLYMYTNDSAEDQG